MEIAVNTEDGFVESEEDRRVNIEMFELVE